ncbi:conserved hypothetical protein [Klebsiella pneumoniae subsp. pneumoniae Ecl8]|uniref:Uncharacterized protein n=2 Tax=Klebsiella pneumoniae TaxID=573 RepID=A0A8E6P0B0_KLEPN|nr:hypothetical protein SGH10_005333 [Klebsiella pneumoniae]QVQ58100.1 hypothetical protein [Klebsiella pneumoniae]QXV90671.1 hypothetical protein [Klebsiella pneumoniae subsp. pneumoniae]CCN32603.1 conserved hypothetical protein [Klebsiella pneumoniae subsp. pneumoniae Ecl8]
MAGSWPDTQGSIPISTTIPVSVIIRDSNVATKPFGRLPARWILAQVRQYSDSLIDQ